MTQLLTEAQAAERLLISLSNLRDIRRRGGIRYVAISTRQIAYRPRTATSMFSLICGSKGAARSQAQRPPPVCERNRPSASIIPFSQRKRQAR
jgi:hypothetical protein